MALFCFNSEQTGHTYNNGDVLLECGFFGYIGKTAKLSIEVKWGENMKLENPDIPGISQSVAYVRVEANGKYLKTDTLLHGDFCLPNIMLKDWKLSGFIDLGGGGVGDKHIDLFWGAWTLNFNLKDARWSSYFLDAYGREDAEEELLRTVAAAEVFL
jgi:kanamycin kinase